VAREISIGDQVSITATVVKRISDDRVSISIPSYRFPYSIFAPKAKLREKLELTGEVTRVDDDAGKVTVQIGSLVTVDIDKVRLVTKYRPPQRRVPLRDKAD
jgi:hypothetical protein